MTLLVGELNLECPRDILRPEHWGRYDLLANHQPAVGGSLGELGCVVRGFHDGSLNVLGESEAGPFNGFTKVSGSTGEELVGLHQVLTDCDEASVEPIVGSSFAG